MKQFAQNSFEDDEDIDELFSQLEQFTPPADFVQRVMQAVAHLPLPQMLNPDVEQLWNGDNLVVHHEHKQPS